MSFFIFITTTTLQFSLVTLTQLHSKQHVLFFIVINNTLCLMNSIHLCMDVEPDSAAWSTYQGPHLQQIVNLSLLETINYQYLLH